MASCKLGHVYIVQTVLTKPPKDKYAVCVCPVNGFFVWINSKPRAHGKDQMPFGGGLPRTGYEGLFSRFIARRSAPRVRTRRRKGV